MVNISRKHVDVTDDKLCGDDFYEKTKRSTNVSVDSLQFFVINARSVCNKIDELRAYASEWKPHVIVVTESWAHCNLDDSFFCISHYALYRRDRLDSRGGGVMMYIHSSLSSVEILRDNLFIFEDCVACKVFVPNGPSLSVAAFYRSPSSSNSNNLSLAAAISMVMRHDSTYHILCGDFNFPDIDWCSNASPPTYDFFMDVIDENSLEQLVRHPTRDKAILDLFFCDDPGIVGEVDVREPLGQSDHNIVVLKLNIPVITKQSPLTKVRFLYSKADWSKFRSLLMKHLAVLTQNAHQLTAEVVIEDCWLSVKNALLDSAHRSIPISKVKPFQNSDLWKFPEVRKLLKRKYITYKKYKNSTDPKHKDLIRKSQRSVKKAIRHAKIEIENVIAESAASKPKTFWRHVRGRLKAPAVVPVVQKPDGTLTVTDGETASVLNDFFASVFTREAEAYDPSITRSIDCECSLANLLVSPQDVANAISRLKKDASPGPDSVPNRLLVESRDILSPFLADFFNLLLRKGSLPNDWRDADVIPIHKSGSFASPNNYRPISLTSSICKIFERIVHCRILSYLMKNKLLASSQHGFLPRKSCLTAHLECLEKVTQLLDSGKPVDMIYFDFRKAFDSVPHQRLLAKLKCYGISGSLLRWISSFLTARRQRVVLRNEHSGWLPVESGVPQGSVLGPLLFLMYVNDVDSILSECQITKFADDLKIYAEISDRSLQSSIDGILAWASTWLLKVHPEKCNVLHFGHNNSKVTYCLGDAFMNQKNQVRDLGIFVDDSLKWSQHCIHIAKRAHRLLTIIGKTFISRNPVIILKMYKALVLPVLDYLSPIWSPYLKRDIETIEKVQRRLTRFFPGIRKLSYRDRLSSLGLKSLQTRRLRQDLIIVFKIVHGFLDVPFDDFFTFCPSLHKTRGHPYKLYVQNVHLNCRKHFFSQRSVLVWNELPDHIVVNGRVSSFINFIDKYFDDNDIW